MSVEEIMACSEIKLLPFGDGKFAEIRNIHTPTLPGTWPCPMHNTRNGKTSLTETTTNKRKRTKTTCRDGHKPGSSIVTRQAIKSSRVTPTHSPEKVHNKLHHERISTRPLRDNRSDINYSVLNDGYDVETSSPKRGRRHSSRPQSKPTVPRQVAQKKIVETKIHLSSQYDNLDLEKIMDSQYPALQIVPLSGVTNGTIDRMKPYEEEYIMPLLGTLMVHGVTENKLDPDNIDLEEMASTENKTENNETESELHNTHLQTQPDDTPLPKNSESLLSEPGNGVTIKLVQDSAQILQQSNNNGTTKLHGVTNNVGPDQEVTQQPVVQPGYSHEDELLKGATNPTEPMDNSAELKGVMITQNIQVAERHDTDTVGLNGITKNSTQTPNSDVSNAEQNKPETLPDLVLNKNSTVNEANTTEDEDEAAEALLQLSKSDTLPDKDTELPLGVLPVDAAPVPITLGNQDVLNTIENFKQNNGETGITPNNDDPKTPGDAKQDNNEKENNNKDKKDNTGNLVIVKHGIQRNKSMGCTYKCVRCNKCKSSTQELNKHYRLKHKPLMCGICNKLFDLPGTLKKHMYGHLDKPFKCDKCSESFHFESELSNYKVVHRTIHTHFCMAQNCGRSFMRKLDLSIHVQMHDKDTWQCAECDWMTTCKKYLQAHLIGHEEDLCYKCDQCDEKCKFREQLRRHKKKEHKTAK